MSAHVSRNGLDNWMGEYLEHMRGNRNANPKRSELGLSTSHPSFGDLAFHANVLLRAKILERTEQPELRKEDTASPMFSEGQIRDIVMGLEGDPKLSEILSAVRAAVMERASDTPLTKEAQSRSV